MKYITLSNFVPSLKDSNLYFRKVQLRESEMKTTGFSDQETDTLTKEAKYNKKNSVLSGYLSQRWEMERTATTVEAQICDK
ncbi:hypothetical protein MSBRW_1285 [Methanosarcina barkeri str. Wiesmoor]|uniref:Uncharacterized protein n=1 Tax=Methanosarcina barkeri str. Wiesmoor TaxID=1434109 RepID=A0A0E3QKA9_METBA|nr:hypothetical protein MSBRW_1285 [Methanosarcina barkeri str. Wiesmoor]